MVDLEALRPLFVARDIEVKACAAAVEAEDMQAWLSHAYRCAEIDEELARQFGWRDEDDHEIIAGPVTRGDLDSMAAVTGRHYRSKNFTVEYEDDDD